MRQLAAPGQSGIFEPSCDLLLLDEEESTAGAAGAAGSEAARVAADLKRLARRLRIPVHERNWAIQVGGQGQFRLAWVGGLEAWLGLCSCKWSPSHG